MGLEKKLVNLDVLKLAYDELMKGFGQYTNDLNAAEETGFWEYTSRAINKPTIYPGALIVQERGSVIVQIAVDLHRNNNTIWMRKKQTDGWSEWTAVGEPGIMTMEIDENGHLIYTRSAAADADFSLTDGHLIMEVEA